MNSQTQQSESGVLAALPSRWTSGWWLAVIAAEVVALVVLGLMAYGERFPFYPPDPPSFTPVTAADQVTLGVLAVNGLALFIAAITEWWKPGVSAVLAVAVAVVVVGFGWGQEDHRLLLHDPPVPLDVSRAMHTCYARDPVAVANAFPVGRVPEECRDIWTGDSPLPVSLSSTQPSGSDDPGRFTLGESLGTSTTTTRLTVESAREDLALVLGSQDRDALRVLADAYEAMARSFDTNDQAALIAWNTAHRMGDEELLEKAEAAIQETWESLDLTTLRVFYAARDRLNDQLLPRDWRAIDVYLSLAPPRASDFDRFLDTGFRLNMAEVDAIREALN